MRGIAWAGPPALPADLRRPIGLLAVLSALGLVVFGVRYAGQTTPSPLDDWLTTLIPEGLREPGTGAVLVDHLGEPVPAIIVALVLATVCAMVGRHRLALLALAGPAVAVLVTILLKIVVQRRINGDHLAYPSGHTAAATAFALVAMLLVVDLIGAPTVLGVVLIVVGSLVSAGVMAVTQVTLSAHYPTDTIGGFCTAMAVVPAIAVLIDWLADRDPMQNGISAGG